jgi:hypothetical protein
MIGRVFSDTERRLWKPNVIEAAVIAYTQPLHGNTMSLHTARSSASDVGKESGWSTINTTTFSRAQTGY